MLFKKIFASQSAKSRSEGNPAMIDLTAIEIKDMRSMGQYLNGVLFNVAIAFGANQKTLNMLGAIDNKPAATPAPVEKKSTNDGSQTKAEDVVPFEIPIFH